MVHFQMKRWFLSDDENILMEFEGMCDNVINIILHNLDAEDLANFSDTNNRSRNIAASVFFRKFGLALLYDRMNAFLIPS